MAATMEAPSKTQQYCSKCRKTMADNNFYTYKDGSKCELCKACLTMHINNWEPDTFLWLLEKFDIPYIESEWNTLRDRAYQKDPYKMTGMTVFGRYLSKLKLKQYQGHNSWADTEYWKEKAKLDQQQYGQPEEQIQQKIEEMREAYERGEISEAQLKTFEETHAPEPTYAGTGDPTQPKGSFFGTPAGADFVSVDLPDVGADLTEEDKIYLAMKWGRLYNAAQWVALEQLYNEFMNSFDIQGAARIDTLKKICKTSLKMDEAIDCGDVDTYQKLSRVYDAMMKSAKFTEAQNKEGKADFVDSIGQLVAYCEKEGGQIPKYEIKEDYDIIDTVIRDLKEYTKTLIYEDKSLAQEIEQYLKNKEAAESMRRDKAEARAKGNSEVELEDKDYQEFREAIENDIEEDIEMYKEEEESE